MRSSQMRIRLMKQVPFEGPICKAWIASQIPWRFASDPGFERDFCRADLLNPGEANADNRYRP
jgi:hypothetical protein